MHAARALGRHTRAARTRLGDERTAPRATRRRSAPSSSGSCPSTAATGSSAAILRRMAASRPAHGLDCDDRACAADVEGALSAHADRALHAAGAARTASPTTRGCGRTSGSARDPRSGAALDDGHGLARRSGRSGRACSSPRTATTSFPARSSRCASRTARARTSSRTSGCGTRVASVHGVLDGLTVRRVRRRARATQDGGSPTHDLRPAGAAARRRDRGCGGRAASRRPSGGGMVHDRRSRLAPIAGSSRMRVPVLVRRGPRLADARSVPGMANRSKWSGLEALHGILRLTASSAARSPSAAP